MSKTQITQATREMGIYDKEKLLSPGPGMYQSSSAEMFKMKSTQVKFGTSKRQDHYTKNSDQPGPGNYNVDQKKSGGFAMGGKNKEKYSENPGPGSYNANSNGLKASAQGAKIGSERRALLSQSKSQDLMPGPGNYND